MPPCSKLRVGDCLLYGGTGFFSWLIRTKTWSRYSHIEVYDGSGQSLASRDGIGVGRYPFRAEGLLRVRRPIGAYNRHAARAWFKTVDGQGYDWVGLLSFMAAAWQGRENQQMFCSEFALRLYRAGGIEPFTARTDADAVAPAQFDISGVFADVWSEEHAA